MHSASFYHVLVIGLSMASQISRWGREGIKLVLR